MKALRPYMAFIQTYKRTIHTPTLEAFNIYATGTAPSYFNGGVQFDLTHSQGGTQDQLQLDRYEEGTFTAKFTNEPGVSYTNQYGHYTIIGNLCIATYFLFLTDAMDTTSADNLRLELPIKQLLPMTTIDQALVR